MAAEILTDRSDPMTEFSMRTALRPPSTAITRWSWRCLSGKSWQLGAVVLGVSRHPKRGLKAGAIDELLRILERWKAERAKAGREKAPYEFADVHDEN
jgi:hypothetical protein